jgi:hypothetical protein
MGDMRKTYLHLNQLHANVQEFSSFDEVTSTFPNFRLPLEEVDLYEPLEHHMYDAAHRRGLSNRNCPKFYSACRFSLIDMVPG